LTSRTSAAEAVAVAVRLDRSVLTFAKTTLPVAVAERSIETIRKADGVPVALAELPIWTERKYDGEPVAEAERDFEKTVADTTHIDRRTPNIWYGLLACWNTSSALSARPQI
jgi:hypothetical protein